MKIAFYAPLKPPDHPVPSGDRQMARQLISALEAKGNIITIPSHLRSYLRGPSLSEFNEAREIRAARSPGSRESGRQAERQIYG